jgi:hypothetical protein
MMTTISQKMTGLGKRVLAQTAMSATVMTGLHFAAVSDFPPARWVFGPGDAAQSSPAGEPGSAAAGAPTVRIVALPLRPDAAFVPAGTAAPSATSAQNAPPSEEREVAMIATPASAACGPACPPEPGSVAHPTPRPAAPRILAEKRRLPASVPTSAPRSVPADAPRQAMASLPVPVPDEIPMPPSAAETSGFVLADLIPGRRVVMEGVSYVGGQARDVVAGAASGALDLVRR